MGSKRLDFISTFGLPVRAVDLTEAVLNVAARYIPVNNVRGFQDMQWPSSVYDSPDNIVIARLDHRILVDLRGAGFLTSDKTCAYPHTACTITI